MPKNIKIVSVLTFSILTLHLQLHAKEISKGPNNPNKKDFSIFNADQSKIKYATFAENNSQVKEYGELYPDYKAETLEDFLQEYSVHGIAGNEFSRFLDRKPAYRMRRCPSRKYQHYFNVINTKNEKLRKVRLIPQLSAERINKLAPCNKQCNAESGRDKTTNIDSKKYYFKKPTSSILSPSIKVKSKLPFYNYSDSLVFTTSEFKLDSTQSPFDKTSMKSMIKSDYYLTKGGKHPVPNPLPMIQTMYANKTKHFYDPYKSTKAVSKADRLPGESYLFDTTTPNVFRVKGSHVSNQLYHQELKKLDFDNQSNNASSLNAEETIIEHNPSMINLHYGSNVRGKIGSDTSNKKKLNYIKYSFTPPKKNPSFDSKSVLIPSLDNAMSVDRCFRNAVKGNGRNDIEYFNENKEKAQSKNQQEAVFVSEKDYIVHEADQRNLETSKHFREKGNTLKNNKNIDSRNINCNISKMKRDSRIPRIYTEAEKFQQRVTTLGKRNHDEISGGKNNIKGDIHPASGIGCYSESALLKNTLNNNLSALNLLKREAFENSHGHGSSHLLSNFYDDYDYYFIIGDNNTDESPFQNDYRAMNVRTAKNLVGKFELNNETASGKLEHSKNLIHNKKIQSTFINKPNPTINNTIENFSTLSPNIIQKLWPNVGNKEKLSLQDGKNYILNLFRRKGNCSKKNNLDSSTPSQTLMSNFFFRKRSKGNELKEVGRKAFLQEEMTFDESYRKYKRNVKPTVELLNNQSSIFQSNVDTEVDNLKDIFEKSRNVERPKRKSAAVNHALPIRPLPQNKHLRRSVANGEDDYNTKFQNLQKDLLELQKAISAPRAARPARNEEKNLTLQIRVIVDVVNNSLGPTENPEDEQLKKRDTKLFEKKDNLGKVDVIPMPLEHDSPLVGEKKGTDVLRNKRVDGTVKESLENNIHAAEKESSPKSDLSDDIIRNITYLLDNLLENYKLQNGNGKKNSLDHSATSNSEYYRDQKFKNSFIHLRKSAPFDVKACKPFMRGTYNFSTLYKDSKKQELNDVTEVNNNNNNLLMEIKKLLPSEMFTLLNIRNRRATNEKQLPKKLIDYNNRLFQDEISALHTIVENIKNKLVLKKIMDSSRNEDNLLNEIEIFQNVEKTSEIPLEDSTSNINYNNLQVVKYSHGGYNAKVDDILETIQNIGKELQQIDSKEKLLQGILGSETRNHKSRNKKKIKRKKNNATISSLKPNKANVAKSKKNTKIKKNIKEKQVKKKFFDKTELPPCCETSTMDEGNHLTIEWCCALKDLTTLLFKTNGSSTCSVTAKKELCTEESQTTSQKNKQIVEESKTSTTQNPNQAAENATSEAVLDAALATLQIKSSSISSTYTTDQVKSSGTSATQTTNQIKTSTSATQTTYQINTSTSSTHRTTQDEESTTRSTQISKKYVKKINHNHGRQVNRKHSRYKENLFLGKYITESVEESFHFIKK